MATQEVEYQIAECLKGCCGSSTIVVDHRVHGGGLADGGLNRKIFFLRQKLLVAAIDYPSVGGMA